MDQDEVNLIQYNDFFFLKQVKCLLFGKSLGSSYGDR